MQDESGSGACLAGLEPRRASGVARSALLPGSPPHLFRQNTRKGTFLRNLLTITRNRDGVNVRNSRPLKLFRTGSGEPFYLISCSVQALLTRANSPTRRLLRR